MADRSPDDPELLLENVASLDTARMTLRWALERIRGLERTHAETQELLQRSFSGRQAAEGELADFKKAVDERGRKLAEKERFVGDMQKILNDLFKGEVDVAEFVKRRQALDEERATLESRVRRRLEDAEAAQKREVEENAKRLADMEGVYSASVAEAQRRFHAEVERLEREQSASLKAERERFDQFRAEAHVEGARAADEYQRRILILEHEYAGKRREMTEDLDRLKARLETEVQTADGSRQAEAARASGRWDAERAQIEARLADREGRLTHLEAALQQAEAAYFAREEGVHAAHAKEVEALRGRWNDESAARQKLLEEAHAEITRREDAFQSERMQWVAERNELRARVAAEYEPILEALRERLAGAAREADAEHGRLLDEQSALRRQDTEKFANDLRSLESAHHDRDLAARRESDADLEALRRHFDEALARQRAESRKEIESHAAEVLTLRARLRSQQEELTASLEAAEKRRSEDLRSADVASAARHADDLERLGRDRDQAVARLSREHEDTLVEANARLSDTQARLAAEREALVKQQEAVRAAEAERFRDALSQQAASAQAREEYHLREAGAAAESARRGREALALGHEHALAKAEAAERERAQAREAEFQALRAAGEAAARTAADERANLSSAYEEALRREAAGRRDDLAALAAKAAAELRESEARRLGDTAALAAASKTSTEDRVQMSSAYEEALRREASARRSELEALSTRLEAALRESEARRLDEGARAASEHSAALGASEARRLDDAATAASEHSAALSTSEARRLSETAALAAEHRAALHAAAAERLADLERLRRELDTPSSKDAAAQIEDMTRQCRRALEALEPAKAVADPESSGPVVVHAAPRRWPWALGAGLAAAAAAGLLLAPRPAPEAPAVPVPVPVSSPVPAAPSGGGLSVPFRNVTGLVWQGTELWATDWREEALFKVSVKDGAVASAARFPLPSTHPTGLAIDGADFYITDSWTKLIQRWRLQDDVAILTGSWPSPGPQPSALFHDGKSLWSADSSQNKVYRHASDPALTVVAVYEMDFPVVGLWADNERLWSADTANRLIHRHRFDDALSLVASYGLPELDDGKARLSAFAMKDGAVWLGRDGDPRLLARPLSDFAQRPFSPPAPAPAAP